MAEAAEAPAAPSNLRVKPLGVNSFRLDWKDNSNNETGWEIRVALSGTAPQRFVVVPAANITSYTIVTNELPGKTLVFQMTAYSLVNGNEKLSKPTPIVSAKALAKTTFDPPQALKAKTLDDGRILLSWKDKSSSETGYQMDIKTGSAKTWVALGNVNPGTSFKIPITGVSPATKYSFRVRGYKSNPVKFTSYSNVASARTKAFEAPSKLVATPSGEGAFTFQWSDNSFLEQGVELQGKPGTGDWVSIFKAAGADFTKTDAVNGFLLDTDYQFRLRAYRLVGTTEVFSGFTNVFSTRSAPLLAPTNLAGTVTDNTTVGLTWKDMSAFESGYEIEYREVGTTEFSVSPVYSQQENVTLNDFPPNKLFELRIRVFSFFQPAKSAYTELIRLQTKDTITSNLAPPIVVGRQFLYQILSSANSALTGVTVTGLPLGLVFNSTRGTISGTLNFASNSNVTVTANYADGSKSARTLVLNTLIPSPVATQSFASVSVPRGTNKTVSLAGKYADPDTLDAARVVTSLGNFDIILFPTSTPSTNNNFIDYVNARSYADSFIHRSPVDFVVQGGGFKHTDTDGFSRVTTFPSVLNEPGLSNVRGTVAMAKQKGFPNSATSEWFVNVNNNSANLDVAEEGYTVFGRVPTSGMAVVDAINNLPIGNYTIPINTGLDLEDVPVNAATAPATLDPAQLVKIISVGAAPILTYQVLSQNSGVATAALNPEGTDVIVTGVATGNTAIQVIATDLDGNAVSQNIPVIVP